MSNTMEEAAAGSAGCLGQNCPSFWEINVGGYRGWRQSSMLHAGMFSSKNGPGYRDTGYGVGAGTGEPIHKGSAVPAAGT
ncbi:hypothetical protein NC653_021611 [Populus alba x Populus x berolinensis]|uniref:Uncharacterized protein n=1 Tax=Populus alba x Populus x berolinensis TaxID=444605 RepID=A0AAD6MNZ6_9ROSI|nr:hypothetical protein NC653_021611 [Populus alba x Populus x berolinensis]